MMTDAEILKIYPAVSSDNGQQVLAAAKDYMVEKSAQPAFGAEQIKGMGCLINYLSSFANKAEQIITNKQEKN